MGQRKKPTSCLNWTSCIRSDGGVSRVGKEIFKEYSTRGTQ